MIENATLELINSVFFSLSALAAAGALVFAVYRQTIFYRRERLLNWQMGVVQRIFQKNAEHALSYDQIIQIYRSEASALRGKDISADDLSETSLRSILIKLIRYRIISQGGGDTYSLQIDLHKKFFDQFGSFSDIAVGHLDEHLNIISKVSNKIEIKDKIKALIFKTVDNEPFKYNKSDIILRVSENLNTDTASVTSVLMMLISGNDLSADTAGRIGIPKTLKRGRAEN